MTMNKNRIEQIQKATAFPDSLSVMQALNTVWNETQQGSEKEIRILKRKISALEVDNHNLQNIVQGRDINGVLIPGKLLQEP
jgi:hypothetical protein